MTRLPCAPEHWTEFSALLDAALDLPAAERAAWLQGLPPESAHLRSALSRVLRQDEPGAPQLELPHLAGVGEDKGCGIELRPQQALGPWRLLRRLGLGGMGEVWLAERCDGAYQRQVALKLPHAQALAGPGRQRFARERDILAALQHPHIAQFFDAGTAEDAAGQDQPWLALEYVEGQSIAEDCKARHLPLRERLLLMLQVMEAVQHAHGRLLVHRDLKPSNVMVAAQGQVKLLDFGIAKLLGADGDAPGGAEATRLLMATPAYAAPEQLNGSPITVATDVFALGALSHTLLCGQPPARGGGDRLASQSVSEGHAEGCGLSRRRLQRALRGDLDAWLAKALAENPSDRYGSVQAMSEDLRRYLAGRPLQARRIGAWSRLRLAWRRHWLMATLLTALILSLALGLAGTAWQAHQAQRQAQRAEAIQRYLLGLFRTLDPRESDAQDPAAAMRRLLQQQMAQIEQQLPQDPETADALLRLSSTVATYLSDEARSLELAGLRWRLLQQRLGPGHPRSGEAGLSWFWALWSGGQRAQAAEVLALLDTQLPARGLLRAEWWLARHDVLEEQGAVPAARRDALQQALQRYQGEAPQDSGHVVVLGHLARWHLAQGERAEAKAWLDRALALAPRAEPPIALDQARLLGLRAELSAAEGQPEAQARDLAEAVRLLRGSLGLANPLGWALLRQQLAFFCEHGAAARAQAEGLWGELQPAVVASRDARGRRLLAQAEACGLRR